MSIVHALGNYCFYFLLAWLPLFLTKSRGFTIGEMTLLATLGYAVQGVLRARLWPFLRLVDALGTVRSRLPPLDDGCKPVACRGRNPGPGLRP